MMMEMSQVLTRVDLLVVGASRAGIDTACAAAQEGKSVCLIERRTYPGAEVTATLRYGHAGEALVPDLFKITLEDRLLAAGVRLYYAMRPIGVEHDGTAFRVAVAGKFGRGLILAGALVDATEEATVARRFGGAERLVPPGEKVRVWRTLELAGVEPDPEGLPPDVRILPGHDAELGHAYLEHALDLVLDDPGAAEIEARYASMALVRHLKETHPAFRNMRLTGAAHELAVPPLWRVEAEIKPGAAEPWPVESRTVDVLVIGGGTSGAACAIGAARQGARTLLVEMNPGLGGTGTLGGVDSYWFGRKGGFNAELSARVAEQHAWMGWTGGKWNIEAKMFALLNLVREAGVQLLLNTVLVEVRTDGAGRVTGALVATPEGLVEVTAQVTVDCTGDGDAAVQAGAPYVYGSSTVDVGDPDDYTRAILSARRRLLAHDHGTYVAPRESRHIIGGVRITLTDIVTMRRWPDVVNIHFSNHDVKGQNTSDWLRMGFLPPNLEVDIPWRALVPNDVEGLIVAGKAISATHDALPPIRMQADLENLGFVCGTAAALCVVWGTTPRRLPVRELQERLVELGILPGEVLTQRLAAAAPMTQAEMHHWVEQLDDGDKLYHYGEMPMHAVRRAPVPIVMVCTAGPAILPLLRAEAVMPGSPRRLMAARALAWYGDPAATPILLEAIHRHLQGDEVPPRTDQISYTQASPDHGAMPELCYLLHSLAMVADERAIRVLLEVAERLNPTMERFTDQHSGLFHYVDAVCDIAERLGRPGCLFALKRIYAYPLFQGRLSRAPLQADYFEERLAYLESALGRAMARCGDPEGLRILAAYLQDSRRMLVRHAHRELQAITGLDLPAEYAPWAERLRYMTSLPCKPWMGGRE